MSADESRQNSDLQEALKFAQEIARAELERIDELHQRTLRYIGFVLAAAGGLFGVIGWMGYQNLQNIAIKTAESTTSKLVTEGMVATEVSKQVRNQLNEKYVANIVNTQINEYTNKELKDQVHSEITTGVLHRDILAIVGTQVKHEFGQRHLTDIQRANLKTAIAAHPDLNGRPLDINYTATDLEERKYAEEIQMALTASGMTAKTSLAYTSAFGNTINFVREGLIIQYEDDNDQCSSKLAKELASVLNTAGLASTIEPVPPHLGGGEPAACNSRYLGLYVGPRNAPDDRQSAPTNK